MPVVRSDDEAVIEHVGRRYLTALATNETDGQKAAMLGLPEGPDDGLRVPGCRVTHRDVANLRESDELSRDDEAVADIVPDRGQHRLVGDETPGRQQSAARRSAEQCGDRSGIG